MIMHDDSLGKIEVTTIPLPEYAKSASATYTYSGKMLIFFQQDDDPQEKDYYTIAVYNDDGSEFRNIFSGPIPQHKKANGIRHMPFADNKRVLLGDYVLECYPDIDTCDKAELIPIEYPWEIKDDPRTSHHWSEIIIAPDNEHMAWTILRTDIGAANMLGHLTRQPDKYVIEEPQVISSFQYLVEDKANEGFLIPMVIRGGEVKQFVRGGTAISLVGAKNGALPDSIVQDLAGEEMLQITQTPGYDETTVFSPDERLGMVMSTRGSKHTSLAILGLMPRPYSQLTMVGFIMVAYMYAVAGVRRFRKGNIGPALIDIERSMNELGYQGVQLNDPEEEWVYLSPMSWHPDGRRAMWPETLRGSGDGESGEVGNSANAQVRLRKVVLHDYQPQEPAAPQPTPNDIPYGIKGEEGKAALWNPPSQSTAGKIAGKRSGYVEYQRQARDIAQLEAGSVCTTYVNFSDDGKTFYNGSESVKNSFTDENVYEADIEMTGERQGEMKLRLTFSKVSFEIPPRLLFDMASDGKPKSYGYARYNGTLLNVVDLVE